MKRNDSRAIARLKRMYRVFKDNLFIKDGKKWSKEIEEYRKY